MRRWRWKFIAGLPEAGVGEAGENAAAGTRDERAAEDIGYGGDSRIVHWHDFVRPTVSIKSMSRVTARMIAWSPLSDPKEIYAVAIRCTPSQQFDRDLYMSLLGDRIQEMVDTAPNPEEAVSALQEAMFSEGLVLDVGHCPTSEAGNRLVWSNPAVEEQLSILGVFRSLGDVKHPLIENLLAHEVFMSQKENPVDNLTMWAWHIGGRLARPD